MWASSGWMPLDACLTWFLKAYFTLYWPSLLPFLCLRTSIPFLFPFPTPSQHRSIASLLSHQISFPPAATKDKSVFSVVPSDCCATSVNSLLPRQARSTFETASSQHHWGQRITADVVKLWEMWQIRKQQLMTFAYDLSVKLHMCVGLMLLCNCKPEKTWVFLVNEIEHRWSRPTLPLTHTPTTNLLNLLSGQWISNKCQGWVSLLVQEETLMGAIWF